MAYIDSQNFDAIMRHPGGFAAAFGYGQPAARRGTVFDRQPKHALDDQPAALPMESNPAALALDKRMLDAAPIHRMTLQNSQQQDAFDFRPSAFPGEFYTSRVDVGQLAQPPMPAPLSPQAQVPMPQGSPGLGLGNLPTLDQVLAKHAPMGPDWTLRYTDPALYARGLADQQTGIRNLLDAHQGMQQQQLSAGRLGLDAQTQMGRLGLDHRAEDRLGAETRARLSQTGRRAAMEADIFKSRLAVHGNAELAARETAGAMKQATESGLFSGDLGDFPGGGSFPITPGALGGGQQPQGQGQVPVQPPPQRGKIDVQQPGGGQLPGEAPNKYKADKRVEDVFTDKFYMGPAGQGGERKQRPLPDFIEAVNVSDAAVFTDPAKFNKLVDFVHSNYGASAANTWLQAMQWRWGDPNSIGNMARRRVLEAQERFTGQPTQYVTPTGMKVNPNWTWDQVADAQVGNIGRWVGRAFGGDTLGRGIKMIRGN